MAWCCRIGTCCLVVLLLLVVVSFVHSKAVGEYLYHIPEAEGIVIDYDETNNLEPDFLYAPDQGYRVVEFYAPWCPHVS